LKSRNVSESGKSGFGTVWVSCRVCGVVVAQEDAKSAAEKRLLEKKAKSAAGAKS